MKGLKIILNKLQDLPALKQKAAQAMREAIEQWNLVKT